MDYTFAYVLKKDLDDKGKYDPNKDVKKFSIRGANLKRAISAFEKHLMEEGTIESKAEVTIIDRVGF